MGLDDLQRVIDRSLGSASPCSRSLFEEATLDAAGVQHLVNEVGTAVVATARPDGRPHAAAVPVACLDGTIHLAVAPRSVLQRHLAVDTRVAVGLSPSVYERSLMAEGVARIVGRADVHRRLLDELRDAVK